MSTMVLTQDNEERAIWHVVVDVAYEGTNNETCQDGVEKVMNALNPLIENGSGIKRVFLMRLPEKN